MAKKKEPTTSAPTAMVSEPPKHKIALLTETFSIGDLNVIRDKINEIITRLQ